MLNFFPFLCCFHASSPSPSSSSSIKVRTFADFFFSFLEDFLFGGVFSSLFQRESQDHQFADLEHFFVVVVVAVLVRGELDCFGSGLQNFSE